MRKRRSSSIFKRCLPDTAELLSVVRSHGLSVYGELDRWLMGSLVFSRRAKIADAEFIIGFLVNDGF